MSSVVLSTEQKALAAAKTTLRGQIGSMFASTFSNVDGEVSRLDGRVDGVVADIATINTAVTNLDSVYSTDAERIAAVNALIASYTDADVELNDTLTAALALKESIANVDTKVQGAKDYADAGIAVLKTYTDSTFLTSVSFDAVLGTNAELGLV